jgi:hypothetical protein
MELVSGRIAGARALQGRGFAREVLAHSALIVSRLLHGLLQQLADET